MGGRAGGRPTEPAGLEAGTLHPRNWASFHTFTLQTAASGDPDLTLQAPPSNRPEKGSWSEWL